MCVVQSNPVMAKAWRRGPLHMKARRWLQVWLPLIACVLLGCWMLLAWFGIDSRNINDLLINQEINRVGINNMAAALGHPLKSIGLKWMRKTNVTIIGVGKDVAAKLPSVLRQIDELAAFFDSSRAIFAEGDSKDGTNELLQSWASRSHANRTILRSSSIGEKEPSGHFAGGPMPREGRISKARNTVLDTLFNSPAGLATEYVMVVDMDVLGWDPSGVADSFGRSGWDVMCAHGILLHGIYRDTYAFRIDGINTNHHWAGKDHGVYNISDTDYKVLRLRLKASQKRAREMMDVTAVQDKHSWLPWAPLPPEPKPIRVQSCFGGLAIYRFDKMRPCRYAHRHAEPPYMLDCEHVLLHKCMTARSDAKIFSNFNFKVWYGHSNLNEISLRKVVSSLAGS